jgi:translocator protein
MKNKIMLMSLSVVSFIFMIMINVLANTLPINGYNTGQLSALYPNLFVPAGITFSIWGLIYISLILFGYGLYKLKNIDSVIFKKLSILFIISNLLNGGWLLAWHYKLIELSLIIMIALLWTLIRLYIVVKSISDSQTTDWDCVCKFCI